MHSLEYLLLLLSRRIRDETEHAELSEAAAQLASISHNYHPHDDKVDEALNPMVQSWREAYGEWGKD